jgi:cob(I)alamin adenosyltransferase
MLHSPIRYNLTMARYFTKKGDRGVTGLLGKSRVAKSHLRIRTVGSLDEASAALGLARAMVEDPQIDQLIKEVQTDLYQVMTLVVLEQSDPDKFPDLSPERITWLESLIEGYQTFIPDPEGFILPGDNQTSAAFSLARTIVRRAEREAVELSQAGLLLSESALPYLNRLSSLCYVLELYTSGKYSIPNIKS